MLHALRMMLGRLAGASGPQLLISQSAGFSGSGTTSTFVTITQSGDLDFMLPSGYDKIDVAVDITATPPNAIGGDATRSWTSKLQVQIDVGMGFTNQGAVDSKSTESIRTFDEIEEENVYEVVPGEHEFTVQITGLSSGVLYSVRVLQDVDPAPNAVENHTNTGSVSVTAVV